MMVENRTTLNELKQKIDRLDRDLIKLLTQRAKLFVKTVELGKRAGSSDGDETADDALLRTVVELNKGPLGDRCVRAVARELLSGMRVLIRPQRVAYLGPPYSYSHIAAVEKFGDSVDLVPVANIAAVFEEVNRRQADFGLVPIENSTDGRIADTLDMFTRLPVRVCGEVQLRIHHHLLGKCSRGEVREVYSKPQAFSQCRDWLARHLPAARTVEMASTAAAAQLAAEKQGAAAVASLQAGVNYGLEAIASNIEDNKNNITRFAVIGTEPAAPTGNDKTSLMFQISHEPGSLADAMTIFKRAKLNLTWIESFPIPDAKSEYLFFVELEGHQDDAKVKKSLATLREKTLRLEILGSYAKTDPLD